MKSLSLTSFSFFQEFKLQIREIAQLTRSVNGIWAETGYNPLFFILEREGEEERWEGERGKGREGRRKEERK